MKYFIDENNTKVELKIIVPDRNNETALCYDEEGNEYVLPVSEIREGELTFKELRQASKMTQREFSEYFHIPKRTIESWEEGIRKCNDYIIELMAYKLKNEGIIQ